MHTQDLEWSGWAGFEPRIFFEGPAYDEQPPRGFSPSAVIVPEVRYDWNDGQDRLTAVGFFRYDSDDDNRTHVDLREAHWQHFSGPWSVLVGLGKVFWGVTESRHLVDIINQTDLVEDIDQEQKLGQPMVQLERWSERGTVGLFILPGFRERTFPSDNARLRGPFPISEDPVYESGAEEHRVDVALRWSNSLDDWDIGVAGFYGTGREPRLVPVQQPEQGIELVPHYDVITQIGVDVQYTRDAWLWKIEAIGRSGQGDDFVAAVGGVEYTFYSVSGSNADLGLLAEYLYDDRGAIAPSTVLEDDVFLGTRFTLNDPDDTNILAGTIIDLETGEMITLVEAERRLGERWVLGADLRLFSNVEDDSQLAGIRQDSYLVLRANWYF